MPKSAHYSITWSKEEEIYLFSTDENETYNALPEDWLLWLEEHRSFAFHGRNGHLNLLKEKRSRGGDGYWYAYQRHKQGMTKRYIGRSDQVYPEHLEEIAALFTPTSSPTKAQPEPLLMPKLQLPRPQKSLIPRDHLLTLLDQSFHYKLTRIAGPAGYGKTTLVSQWLDARTPLTDFPQVACLTLDENDNDPIRFWSYIISACQKFRPDFGKEALKLLYAHRLPPFKSLEIMLTTFLNELSLLDQPAILILDDFHVIRSSQVTKTLGFLLDHLPTSFHLVILMRGDPPFSLTRLNARNELLDIQPPYLTFSLEETRAFFEQELPFPLSPKLLRQIFERLDGWPTGLRLLISELHWPNNSQDIEQALTTFAGSNWSVREYFLNEIFHALPLELQEFLLRTSFLPRLTSSLGDIITGHSESARLINILRESDLFLIPLDSTGTWSRYHSLFAETMQQEASKRLGDEELRLLLTKASIWYEEHGFLAEAIQTALSASAFLRAATLIEQLIHKRQDDNSFATAEHYTLSRWLEGLPANEIERHPVLCLHYALTLLFILMEGPRLPKGKERIYSLLQTAEQKWRDANNTAELARVFAFRALLARQEGKFLQAVTWARQSLDWLPQEDRTWRNLSLTVVGVGELVDGHLDKARPLLLEALSISEHQGNLSYARAIRGMLASVSFEQAELRHAYAQLRQIQAEARIQEDYDDIAHTQLGLAQIAYQWNNLEEAEAACQEALKISEQMQEEEFEVLATLHLALVEHARHQSLQAQQRLTSWLAQHQTPLSFQSYQLSRKIQATLVFVQLSSNQLASVERWFASCEKSEEKLPLLQYQREQLLQARLLLAQGNISSAIEHLENLYNTALKTGHITLRSEVQVVMVLAYERQGVPVRARQLFQEVLVRGHSEGYMRLFLNEGEELANLLRDLLPSLHDKTLLSYARHLLHAFSQELALADPIAANPTLPFLEPLSPQEQKVLRLLAAGNSNAEIAGELVVSVNTIRTQVQSIYRKLQVNNRSAASKIASQIGL